MANNTQLSNAARSAAADAVTALLNVGGAGTIEIYTAPQPAGPNTAISTQTLLATLTYSATAYGAAVNGVATASSITSATAVATGTAAWARNKSGGATAVFDGSVGTAGTDIVLGTAAITTGMVVPLSSATYTQPAGPP